MTPEEKTMLGDVLLRFIERNRTDHGYVGFGSPSDLILDGEVELDEFETKLLQDLVAKVDRGGSAR
jgi:hypothetical protein